MESFKKALRRPPPDDLTVAELVLFRKYRVEFFGVEEAIRMELEDAFASL